MAINVESGGDGGRALCITYLDGFVRVRLDYEDAVELRNLLNKHISAMLGERIAKTAAETGARPVMDDESDADR